MSPIVTVAAVSHSPCRSTSRSRSPCPMWRSLAIASAVLSTGGCATTGDLEKLQNELQASLNATKRTVDQRIATLGADVQNLKGETKAGFELTKKRLEDELGQFSGNLKFQQDALTQLSQITQRLEQGQRQFLQNLKTHEDTLGKLAHTTQQLETEQRQVSLHAKVQEETQAKLVEVVKGHQAALGETSARIDGLVKETTTLRGAVQAENRMMFELLKGEETILNEKLTSVQSLMKAFGGAETAATP